MRRLTYNNGEYIITLKDGEKFTPKETRLMAVKRRFPFINAFSCALSALNAPYAEKCKKVDSMTVDYDIYGIDAESETREAKTKIVKYNRCHSYKIYSPSRNSKSVCFIDTGVNPHLDLTVPKNRIVKFVDLINGLELPYDDNGHGTFVTGVSMGNGIMSGKKISGINTVSDIVSIKAIDKRGHSTAARILEAMQWVADNYRIYNIGVVCMSFGSERIGNDPLEKGVDTLTSMGITVVCASGNGGKNVMRSPATSRCAIAVGAVDSKLNIADFTSRGIVRGMMKPEYYAIGVNVIGLASISYTKMSGTSISAPYVAGICSLIKEKYPHINEEELREYLDRLSLRYNGISII